MPLAIEAVFTTHYDNVAFGDAFKEAWLRVTGATAGSTLYGFYYNSSTIRGPTSGLATATTFGSCLVPVPVNNIYLNVTTPLYSTLSAGFVVRDGTTAETVTVAGPWYPTNNRDAGTWTVTQDADKNVLITCTSLGATSACPVFTPLSGESDSATVNITTPPQIWEITMYDSSGASLYTTNLAPLYDARLPFVTVPSSVLTATGTYFTKIRHTPLAGSLTYRDEVTYLLSTTLTAPTVTTGGGGGNTNMFSWLNNDYWWLTDLQVNLGTRGVTHRHGTVQIKPNDTVNFAVLFHNGSAGKDPVATDLRLAVRSATNTSAYYFWANPSVTTTSVSGDIYYTLTVTASDEDLLAAQASGLLSGSAAAQSLLAEVQWTTTRGTFTSDTFTIEVPSEIIREPDV